MSKVMMDYCRTVAGQPVTVQDARAFIRDMEGYEMERDAKKLINVFYDETKNGYLFARKAKFRTLKDAMDFVRSLGGKSLTLPVIEDEK